MSDFTTLKSLKIPEGVVTQITDEIGAVIWVKGNDPAILEVEKIISDTYAGGRTYPNEEFILLDIYPKNANSNVTVTYCGVSKTLEFTGTNAKTVYFGTFNGVPDKEETPASGTLTIEGGYNGFAVGTYKTYNSAQSKQETKYCSCVKEIVDFGNVGIIPNHAFYACTSITNITIPDSVTSISDYAFYECSSLSSVVIGDSVTSIGHSAFSGCDNLSSVVIGDSVTSISDFAFYSCDALTSISLPNSVTSIGKLVFYGCTDYTKNIYITDIAAWCNISFNDDYSTPMRPGDKLYINGELLTELIIPDSVTSISDYAFYNCLSLKSLTISGNVDSIGIGAFKNCKNVESLNIHEGVTSIGDSAFAYLGVSDYYEKLRTISIPNSVKTIGASAFYRCFREENLGGDDFYTITIGSGITSIGEQAFTAFDDDCNIVMLANTPPEIVEASTFGKESGYGYLNGNVEKIIVPSGCGAAYRAATGWSYYSNYIVEAS